MIFKSINGRKTAFLFTVFLLFFYSSFGQDNDVIKGIVYDSNGVPLPGATVLIKNTSNGTTTNFEGEFEIKPNGNNKTIEVSYLGFKTQEITDTQKDLIIKLQPENNQLDEVVVVGYGSLKRSDVVGAVSSVNVDEATVIPTTNVAEMIRGRAAGVQVNLADARPGGNSNILIRGKVSLEGNDPLIIVDGVPYDNINDIAPDDITSIEILKDASSQAIYGSRAANGVILISTRRGEKGKFKINYHGFTTMQSLNKNFDLYSAEEFAQLRREANRTDNDEMYLDDATIFEPFELEAIENEDYVDWEDLILEDAVIQSHSLSLSGGGENTKVFSSLSYYDQDGLIPTSGYERGTFRINIDQRISDKFSLQSNINLQTSTQNAESTSLNFINISPLAKPFDEDGALVKFPLGEGNRTVNPLWNIREADNEIKTILTDLNLVGKYQFTPSFSYKLNAFSRSRNTQDNRYRSSLHSEADDISGSAVLRDVSYREYLIENIFDYNWTINSSNKLDFTAVQSVNQRKTSSNFIEKSNFANDLNSFNGDASVLRDSSRDLDQRRLVSFMGRVRYNLLDRYLLTLTARVDGSTVFAEDEKYGTFPAAAFAWKIHEEKFLKSSNVLNQLKFRISYGQTGNDGIPLKEAVGVADYIPYVFGGETASGFSPLTRIPNPNLKWETTTTLNTGIDFGLFRNRIIGSLEIYDSNTSDFLLNRVVPGTTGFQETRFNIGEVSNKGVELTLSGDIIRNKNLRWNTGITYSHNKNEITSLAGEKDPEGNLIDYPSQGLFIGAPINNIYQYVFDGIFQEGDDLENSPQTTDSFMPIAGDVKVKDLNEDGVIDDDDRKVISEDPKWFGAFNTTFEYKGFELFADLYVVEGAQRLNQFLADNAKGGTLQGRLNGIKVDYYLPESPSNRFPRPRTTNPSYLYSQAIQDASYVRLRTLSIGYNFTPDLLSKMGISSMKLYATATNLFTITDYKSWSPEINPDSFPDTKGLTIGFKIGI
ncbi:SusC/RagA family TonB-linked outer membrane protein [Joostella sp.]|uniref:SusC/RagA family TonB-linked outer membrane protein n=1 Tax=Joostella sp. TaxID=2231138 RepID=UPI003A907A30